MNKNTGMWESGRVPAYPYFFAAFLKSEKEIVLNRSI